MLNTLSNVDKHRVVHTAIAVLRDPDISPQPARFRVVRGGGSIVRQQANRGAQIEHRAELMRALVQPVEDDTEVEMDGQIPVEIAFGDGLIPSGYIKNVAEVARVIVREFEPDFGALQVPHDAPSAP
jgi:hypothetical protein